MKVKSCNEELFHEATTFHQANNRGFFSRTGMACSDSYEEAPVASPSSSPTRRMPRVSKERFRKTSKESVASTEAKRLQRQASFETAAKKPSPSRQPSTRRQRHTSSTTRRSSFLTFVGGSTKSSKVFASDAGAKPMLNERALWMEDDPGFFGGARLISYDPGKMRTVTACFMHRRLTLFASNETFAMHAFWLVYAISLALLLTYTDEDQKYSMVALGLFDGAMLEFRVLSAFVTAGPSTSDLTSLPCACPCGTPSHSQGLSHPLAHTSLYPLHPVVHPLTLPYRCWPASFSLSSRAGASGGATTPTCARRAKRYCSA